MKQDQKLSVKSKKENDGGKRSKAPNEVKPPENISKNPWRFLEKKPCSKRNPSVTSIPYMKVTASLKIKGRLVKSSFDELK